MRSQRFTNFLDGAFIFQKLNNYITQMITKQVSGSFEHVLEKQTKYWMFELSTDDNFDLMIIKNLLDERAELYGIQRKHMNIYKKWNRVGSR